MDVNPVKRSSTFSDPGKEVYPVNGCSSSAESNVFQQMLATLELILAGQGVMTTPTDGADTGETPNPTVDIFEALETLIALQNSALQSIAMVTDAQTDTLSAVQQNVSAQGNTLTAVQELADANNQSNTKIIECFEQLKLQNGTIVTALSALSTATAVNAEAQQNTAVAQQNAATAIEAQATAIEAQATAMQAQAAAMQAQTTATQAQTAAIADQAEQSAFAAKVAALTYQRANAPCPMEGCVSDGVVTLQGTHEFNEDQYLLAYDDKGNACGYFRIAQSVLGEDETTVTIDPEHVSVVPDCNAVSFECELAITSDAVRECIDIAGAISGGSFDNNCNDSP